jgi:large subunit ribosomal protein L31
MSTAKLDKKPILSYDATLILRGSSEMKPEIHPEYKDVKVVCSCGSTFTTRSTLGKEALSLEVCSLCHPFYTGTQKMVDTAGRVDRFRQKYGMRGKEKAAEEKDKQ